MTNQNDNSINDSADEKLAIYDAAHQRIGIKRRQDVHRDGDRHYVMHCWVYVKSKDALVIQKRSPLKRFGGGQYDVSCAGHYSADEDFTATRELFEELGIEVKYEQLAHVFDFEETFFYDGMVDREIARVHLLIWHDAVFAPVITEEVERILLVKRLDFIALMKKQVSTIQNIDTGDAVTMNRSTFVQRNPRYFQRICEMLMQMEVD
ncbi:NUDIX domain-containing protein [Fusibacter paucivorans]|uniref:NUDIX domain-containing protein n=1 Tax=Fusibacter paucivorans TaxID=76009 RepID=A0ABS5PMG7_9FIRM|nr:NUDIX domain-containing protein [Fusibacter paucivorans]MBS7526057.1 NUDIX domain-containing protein [Fusibacter paucivorans]